MKKLILICLFACGNSFAACNSFFPNNKEPVVINTELLCNSFYAVKYNNTFHAPILTSELLQPFGHTLKRKNSFRSDPRAPFVKPKMFAKTGWDRGHMVPSNDAVTNDEMHDTFLMTNITPQRPSLNSGKWAQLENKVLGIVQNSATPTVVVTGAVYNNIFLNGLPVPTYYYKIVFTNPPQAFVAENSDDSIIKLINLDQLEQQIGITFQ